MHTSASLLLSMVVISVGCAPAAQEVEGAAAAAAAVLAVTADAKPNTVKPDIDDVKPGDKCPNCYGTGRTGDGHAVCQVCKGTGVYPGSSTPRFEVPKIQPDLDTFEAKESSVPADELFPVYIKSTTRRDCGPSG